MAVLPPGQQTSPRSRSFKEEVEEIPVSVGHTLALGVVNATRLAKHLFGKYVYFSKMAIWNRCGVRKYHPTGGALQI